MLATGDPTMWVDEPLQGLDILVVEVGYLGKFVVCLCLFHAVLWLVLLKRNVVRVYLIRGIVYGIVLGFILGRISRPLGGLSSVTASGSSLPELHAIGNDLSTVSLLTFLLP